MTIRLLCFLGCFLSILSCGRDEEVPKLCSVEDPVEDLAWLKTATEELGMGEMARYQYVLQAEYNSSTVFVIADCCPWCDSVFFVYDCSGKIIGSVYDRNIDASILESSTLVWKAQNSICNF